MRILVLATEDDKATAQTLEKGLRDRDFDAVLKIVGEDWENHLLRELEDNENLAVLYGPESSKLPWTYFCAGWLIGTKNPGLLYVPPVYNPLPFTEGITIASDLTMVTAYFERERVFWEERRRRKKAEAALTSLGYSYNQDAFAFSVGRGDLKAVKWFLYGGLSCGGSDASGTPLLCLAARKGSAPMLEKLLEAGADINATSRDRGNTALMDAASRGCLEICTLLVSRGADLNRVSKNKQTALILASGAKNEAIIHLLLEKGANPLPKDKLGMTVGDYARLFKLDGVISNCREAEKRWKNSV